MRNVDLLTTKRFLHRRRRSNKPVHTTQTLTHPNPNRSKSNFDSFIFQTNHPQPDPLLNLGTQKSQKAEAEAQPPLDLSRLKQTEPSLQDSLRSLSPMMVLGGPGGSGIMMDKVLDEVLDEDNKGRLSESGSGGGGEEKDDAVRFGLEGIIGVDVTQLFELDNWQKAFHGAGEGGGVEGVDKNGGDGGKSSSSRVKIVIKL